MTTSARINELLNNVSLTEGFLDDTASLHEQRILESIKASQDRIVNLMRDLEVGAGGRLEGIKINLKQAQRNHKQMINIMQEEYGIAVDEVVGSLDEISRFIQRSWADLGEAAKYTNIDKDMLDTLSGQTWDIYKQFGDDAVNSVAQAMYDQVIAGGKFSDLMTSVQGALTGHVDARGRPMTQYTKQFANDSVMHYHNQVNLKKAEDIGMNEFLYFGNIINATRQFCRIRAGKVYTRNQIDAWTHDWQGKAGPAYEYRGGYNCRHHWQPMKKEWLEDDEFGEITEDELLAESQKDNFPIIKNDVNEIAALKAQHDASQAKSKALKDERKGASPARKKEINRLLKPLKDERRDLKAKITALKGDLKKQGGKIRKDVAAGKKPKTLTRKQLADTPPTTRSVGIKKVKDRGIHSFADFQRDFVDPIVKETDRIMSQMSPKMREYLRKYPVDLNGFKQEYVPRGFSRSQNANGNWRPSYAGKRGEATAQINIAGRRFTGTYPDSVRIGGFNIGHSDMHIWRHELGHQVHLNILQRAESTLYREWDKIFYSKSENFWMDKISLYGSGDRDEAFAEAFAAFTNPNYKKGMLPKNVESFFKKVFST